VPRLPVLSNVLHGALARGAGPRAWFHQSAPCALREEAMGCLERVGLAELALRRADRLSGGQSQRVAIARALMQRPEVMFADEPVASLDPAAGEEVMGCFLDLVRRERLTLVFTTHDLRHALHYGERVVGLREGRVGIDAPAATLDLPSLRSFYG
jgi:phosphonate transport system ATP-binding protein